MNKHTFAMIGRLQNAGVSEQDAWQLRRIAMTLSRWSELECGTDRGCIERDEANGRPFWSDQSIGGGRRHYIADRERGALKRLDDIMLRYPGLVHYHQTDPRGASLYILRMADCVPFANIDSYYSRGIAVHK